MSRHQYLPFGKPDFGDDEVVAVTRVVRSGWVGMGPETAAFEEELASFLGVPHVVTVNSCTSALFLSLLAAGVGPGDEVIVPSLTWCATANAAKYLGATPVFCDVDPDTLSVTPGLVREKLTPRTKAVVPVHYGGLAAPVDGIRRVLPSHIAIIEDAAHAFGARAESGRKIGASGNLTCFSFYANKNLSTGEGGAIALEDAAIADRLRSLRQNALPQDAWKRFTHPQSMITAGLTDLGYKMNYTDLQAALGRVQLRRQADFHARRLTIANYYADELRALPAPLGAQAGVTDPWHSRHLFVVQLPVEQLALTRDEILRELRGRNIGASVHYQPLHRMPLYGPGQPALANTDWVAPRILTLPISASMTLDDARGVIAVLGEVLEGAMIASAAPLKVVAGGSRPPVPRSGRPSGLPTTGGLKPSRNERGGVARGDRQARVLRYRTRTAGGRS